MPNLTDAEFQAMSQIIRQYAVSCREDVIGAFMLTCGFHGLTSEEICALADRIEKAPELPPRPPFFGVINTILKGPKSRAEKVQEIAVASDLYSQRLPLGDAQLEADVEAAVAKIRSERRANS